MRNKRQDKRDIDFLIIWAFLTLFLICAIPPYVMAQSLIEQTMHALVGGPQRVAPPGAVEVAFSPDGGATDLVVKAIHSARQRIDVAAYAFTSAPIARALIDAQHAGVAVRVVIDHEQVEKRNHSLAAVIKDAGVPLRVDIVHTLLHDKYMIIDGKTVETGSFNFTSAAERHNAENVIVMWDAPAVAQAYTRDWENLWNQAEAYGGQ